MAYFIEYYSTQSCHINLFFKLDFEFGYYLIASISFISEIDVHVSNSVCFISEDENVADVDHLAPPPPKIGEG
jgi:hypothetical protein